VVAELRGERVPDAPPVAPMSASRLVRWRGEDQRDELDMADIRGLADARYAVEVAAAGGHHLMLCGPKGSGKTSLAERLPSIMPDLDLEAALELTALHSLAAALEDARLLRRPPWAAPHHDASKASILGGGSGRVHPGELSRAHHGVIFLDEFPLFRTDVVDALRQPMESGEVTVARGEEAATFPARGLVVLAANPCPCGDYHPSAGHDRCRCREQVRRDYRRKLEGPMADRIDIWREVQPATTTDMRDPFARSDDSLTIRRRVAAAREIQQRRHAGRGWRLNGAIPAAVLLEEWPLVEPARDLIDRAVRSGRLSRRGAIRAHRIAWTVADLRGRAEPDVRDTEVAVALRTGAPLPQAALEQVG
jgi:magnesium chelatase family protein